VLDSYFNLTNKSDFIDRLSYDLIRSFGSALLFWVTLYSTLVNKSQKLSRQNRSPKWTIFGKIGV